MALDIDKFTGPDNTGSLLKVFYADVNHVNTIGRPVQQLIDEKIDLLPGKRWGEIYFTKATAVFRETEGHSSHGVSYSRSIQGATPKDSIVMNDIFHDLEGKEFVCVIVDGNNYERVVGSLDEPLSFTCDNATEQTSAGRNSNTWKFTGKSKARAPFYDPVGGSSSLGPFDQDAAVDIVKFSGSDNIGSLNRIDYIDVNDISSISTVNNQLVNEEIELLPGKTFGTIYTTEDTAGFRETQIKGPHGTTYNKVIRGVTPKDSVSQAAIFEDMEGREFVCKIFDANGSVKIVGNLDEPLSFNADNTTQATPSGRNEDTWIFSGKGKSRSPHFETGAYVFINPAALTYFNALVAAGFTEEQSQALYGLDFNAIKEAIDIYFIAIVAAGIVSQMQVEYLYIGGTAATHAINARNPGTFNQVYFGSPSHGSTGVGYNGTNQYGTTGYIPNVNQDDDDAHHGVYCQTNSQSSGFDLGVFNSNSRRMGMKARNNNDFLLVRAYNTSAGAGSISANGIVDARGLSMCSRILNVDFRAYKDGVQEDATAVGSANGTRPTLEFFTGAHNNAGSPAMYIDRTHSYLPLGKKLQVLEIGDHYNAVQALQTTLGREF